MLEVLIAFLHYVIDLCPGITCEVLILVFVCFREKKLRCRQTAAHTGSVKYLYALKISQNSPKNTYTSF